jgi:hypothetical protein
MGFQWWTSWFHKFIEWPNNSHLPREYCVPVIYLWTLTHHTFAQMLHFSCILQYVWSVRYAYLQVAGAGHVITPISSVWWLLTMCIGTTVDSFPSMSWHIIPNLISWPSDRNSHLEIHWRSMFILLWYLHFYFDWLMCCLIYKIHSFFYSIDL